MCLNYNVDCKNVIKYIINVSSIIRQIDISLFFSQKRKMEVRRGIMGVFDVKMCKLFEAIENIKKNRNEYRVPH
jgi:hypothetical protein